MPARAGSATYMDLLTREWRMPEQSRRMQTRVHKVLNELPTEALLILKDPRLEVAVLPDAGYSVWAFSPCAIEIQSATFLVT